ncbi:Adaptive-response sensory-kinase SasA [Paenibacillus plantiphilus]|uniref:histidine kinase n=1 Tax=Paenibacillus plantiphilus TaxID=2905650 RepID=A0ABM9CLB6_9BACL|nr:HAMP domain-containing sensor histidine kinase [Paenibacillus plantiphilus]CAH1216732.1 Adaptive-response sensory-kinase SasA [Paenibacillus plantiphilus]
MLKQRMMHALRTIVVPRSLRYQLLARSLFILAALLLLIGMSQYWLMKSFLYQSKADAMQTQLMSLPRDLLVQSSTDQKEWERPKNGPAAGSGAGNGAVRPDRPFLFLPDMSLAYISADGVFTDISGAENSGNPSPSPSPQLTAAEYERLAAKDFATGPRAKNTEYEILSNAAGEEQLVVFHTIGPRSRSGGPALLQMGTATAPLQDVIMQQLIIFASLSALALTGGLGLYLPALRRTLIPLSRIVHIVKQTDAGNLGERMPENQGQEEIDRLSASFNGMLERFEISFHTEREAKERMRQFIADASHELRTPLTSIHGFLEVLLRGAASNPEQLYNALNSMHGESRRINKLVEDLLLLAKFDRSPQLQVTAIKLDALIYDMEHQLQMMAGERSLQLQIGENREGEYDADKIRQAILNLFHNAVQHTDGATGSIALSLRSTDTGTELSIRDNGSGISEEQLPHVFERFYRGDASRTRKYGGAGLGLSITKSIVEAHGGTIKVASREGEGATFTITLSIRSADGDK